MGIVTTGAIKLRHYTGLLIESQDAYMSIGQKIFHFIFVVTAIFANKK
jgi:hypothetical protein